MAYSSLSHIKGNYFSVAILLTVLLSGFTTGLSASGQIEWSLLDPCGTHHPVRHARSPATHQLNISINQMKELRKALQAIYPNAPEKGPSILKRLKINKLIHKMKDAKTKLDITTEFYLALSQIALVLEKITKIPFKSASSSWDNSKRTKYYNRMTSSIRLALCEATHDIYEEAPDRENILPKKVQELSKQKIKGLPKVVDHTMAQILDYDFFNKVLKFLKRSKIILKTTKKSKQGGSAKNNKRKKKRTKKL